MSLLSPHPMTLIQFILFKVYSQNDTFLSWKVIKVIRREKSPSSLIIIDLKMKNALADKQHKSRVYCAILSILYSQLWFIENILCQVEAEKLVLLCFKPHGAGKKKGLNSCEKIFREKKKLFEINSCTKEA